MLMAFPGILPQIAVAVPGTPQTGLLVLKEWSRTIETAGGRDVYPGYIFVARKEPFDPYPSSYTASWAFASIHRNAAGWINRLKRDVFPDFLPMFRGLLFAPWIAAPCVGELINGVMSASAPYKRLVPAVLKGYENEASGLHRWMQSTGCPKETVQLTIAQATQVLGVQNWSSQLDVIMGRYREKMAEYDPAKWDHEQSKHAAMQAQQLFVMALMKILVQRWRAGRPVPEEMLPAIQRSSERFQLRAGGPRGPKGERTQWQKQHLLPKPGQGSTKG